MNGRGWSRWVALGRSAPVAVVLLVAANLVPLIGVLFLDWDIAAILVLYWIENGIVGVLNALRMLLAARPDPGHSSTTPAGRMGLTAFFILHYGIFWVVHGVFVALLADGLRPDSPVLIGALALLLSHAASLMLNYVGRREYLSVSAGGQMLVPYARMVALHITIVLGAAAVIEQGQPLVLVVLLVVGKTIADFVLHLIERARYERAAAAL